MRSTNPKAFAIAFVCLVTACGMPALAQTKIDDAWEILRMNLNEKDTVKRALAVHVLGLLPGDSLAQELSHKAVEDEKPEVRAAAAVMHLSRLAAAKPTRRKNTKPDVQ